MPVDEKTFLATLPHLPVVVADLLQIIALTGARPSEVRRLKIGDIDRSLAELWDVVPECYWIPGPPTESGPTPVPPFDRDELINQLASIDGFELD